MAGRAQDVCLGWPHHCWSLSRRYTGRPFYKPTGFRIYRNGIRVEFNQALDPLATARREDFFCQQWNYEYAKRYGSPEFSLRQPGVVGHDRLAIASVRLLEDARSIFVEIPEIVPASQLHLRMHLRSRDGVEFKGELFPSVLQLGDRFEFPGAVARQEGKPETLQLRIREGTESFARFRADGLAAGRTIVVRALPGLRYDQTTLTASPDEAITIELRNEDGMPHNFVLVRPGAYEKIGTAAFKMMNDPHAHDKHYVPDDPDVLAYTRVVFPGENHRITFRAPREPGRYPFLCTFPGHWQVMRGEFVVAEAGATSG